MHADDVYRRGARASHASGLRYSTWMTAEKIKRRKQSREEKERGDSV